MRSLGLEAQELAREQDGIIGGKCKSSTLASQTPMAQSQTRKYGRSTDIGETQSKRIGVIKDLLVDLLRRHLSHKVELG